MTNPSAFITTLVLIIGTTISPARADQTTPVWQYELGFGRQLESTFYLSYHTTNGDPVAIAESIDFSSTRIALYSSNPRRVSIMRQLSLFMDDSDEENPSAGKVVGMVIGTLLFLAPTIYAIERELDELNDSWWCSKDCSSTKNK